MKERIIEVLAKQLRIDPSEINENSNIMEDLGADSLDLVEILMTLESEMGIVISDEDALTLKTVGDVAVYLERVTGDK
ncbi:MAG: acyl carrier protein [Ruminococcaceae bacterium]|nr:acyl carrier protein [Oscillospiraceae bacterium]